MIPIEDASLPKVPGHVPWIRTEKGNAAIRALTTNTDPSIRTVLIREYRTKIPRAEHMTDDQIVDVYVKFLMSCPAKCPHCYPEAAS